MIDQFHPYSLELHSVRLPNIEVSKDDKKNLELDENVSNFTYLYRLCEEGYENRIKQGKINPKDSEKYVKRCKEELDMFKRLNLVDYILLIHDVLSWCDKNKIPRGTARGSSACSIVLYLIGCTNIDPIVYNLYFTRFVSEARAKSKVVDSITYVDGKSMPDCDSDLSYYQRDIVVKHIEEKYKGRTAKIGTQHHLTGKLLIKEVSKIVLEYSEEQAKYLADLIEKQYGIVEDLEVTYKNSAEFKKWADSPENVECFKIALSLQNLIKNKSQHASGIAISHSQIDEILPLELSAAKDVITSYNMDEVANEVVKLDILGLKTVDVINEACQILDIKQEYIDINHPSIYKYLQTKNTFYGLFQIEEGLSKKVITEIKPRNIHDLAACIAISRPGALAFIDDYKKFVNNNEIKPFYPPFDEALKETGNIIIYQEQINQICMEVYKMSPTDSDEVRRIIGKKEIDEVKKWKPIIYEAGKKQNIPEDVTERFWDTINKSSRYLFNKGHSYSYGIITAITTYIKANHPKEFFLALLNMSKYEPKPSEVIGKISDELRSVRMELLPPNILTSDIKFKTVGNDILFGLGSIKGVSDKTIEKLNKFRHPHSNKFEIFVGAKEAGLPIGVLNALILTGCLGLNKRSKLVYEAQLFNLLLSKEKQLILETGSKFNYDLIQCLRHIKTLKSEKGKPLIKDSRYKTLKKYEAPYKRMYELNSRYEKLTNWWFESNLLGYAYSTNLMDIYKEAAPDLISIDEVNSSLNSEKVHFIGEVVRVINRKGKETGFKYLKVEVRDHTGTIQTLLVDSEKKWRVQEHKEDNGRQVREGDIVVVKGTKGESIVFADKIGIQACEVMDKISKLRDMASSEMKEKELI